MRSIFSIDRERYVKKYLMGIEDKDKKFVKPFCDDYLKADGVFILRLCGHNTDAVTVSEFVSSLWAHYRSKNVLGNSRDSEA